MTLFFKRVKPSEEHEEYDDDEEHGVKPPERKKTRVNAPLANDAAEFASVKAPLANERAGVSTEPPDAMMLFA